MAVVCAAIFGSGVCVRVLTHNDYAAVDLGLEGSLVMGMLGGYVTGLVSGVLISIPAMFNGELMSMPLLAAVGVLGGLLRDVAPDKEAIWKFSPFPDLTLWRLARKRDLRLPAFSLLCIIAILICELLRSGIARIGLLHTTAVFALQLKWMPLPPWIVVAEGKGTHDRERGEGEGENGRLDPAGHHHVRPARTDHVHAVLDGVSATP